MLTITQLDLATAVPLPTHPVAMSQVPARMNELNAEHDASREFRRHRQILAIACAVGILAFALEELPDGRVSFRGLTQIPLPQTCFSRSWLRLKCPGCGLTRSIIHLAEGDWEASWRKPPAGLSHGTADRPSGSLSAAGAAPARPPVHRARLAGGACLCSNRIASGELAGGAGGGPDWPRSST